MKKETKAGLVANRLRIIKNEWVKKVFKNLFDNTNTTKDSYKILNELIRTQESKTALHEVIDDAIKGTIRSALILIDGDDKYSEHFQIELVDRKSKVPILQDEKLTSEFDWYLNEFELTLKAFSKRLLSKILIIYPQWKDYINVNEHWEVIISVPAPFPKDEDDVLWLAIESEAEVIVGFDVFHGHFYANCYESEDEFITEIIQFLRKIQDGSLLVVKEINNDNNLEYWATIERDTLNDQPHRITYIRAWTD